MENKDELQYVEQIIRVKARDHRMFDKLLRSGKVNDVNVVIRRGSDDPKYLFMGEAPGFTENEMGLPFVGKSGNLLNQWIDELGIPEKDYAIINTFPLLPLDHESNLRKPTEEEVDYFKDLTLDMIDLLEPDFIVLLGRSAESFFEMEGMDPGEWKGDKFFIYHPAYYLRGGKKRIKESFNHLEGLVRK